MKERDYEAELSILGWPLLLLGEAFFFVHWLVFDAVCGAYLTLPDTSA